MAGVFGFSSMNVSVDCHGPPVALSASRPGPELRIHSVAGAHYRGGVAEWPDRQADARAPVVAVVEHQAALGQAGVAGGADRQRRRHLRHQVGGDRRAGGNHAAGGRIKREHAVELFHPRRLVLVAHAEVQSDSRVQFEIVLPVETPVGAPRICVRTGDAARGAGRPAEQKVCVGKPGEAIVEGVGRRGH